MKILYFHQHFSTPKGSAGIRSYAMARKLVENGHEVIMVCGSYAGGHTGLDGDFKGGKRQGVVEGIHVIEFNLAYSNSDGFRKRAWLFARFAIKSINLAMKESYDVLFATSTPLTAGVPGIVARWLRRKPFVFEVRDLWPELPREMGVITNPLVLWAMGALEWVSYKSAHRLIGLSPGIVDGIAKRGIDRKHITMIPNGCDLSIFSSKTHPWRPKEVSDTDFMAVFTGTHGIANGLDSVLDAAAVLKRRGRADIKIVLIGDGKLKLNLMNRARLEQLDNLVFIAPVDKEKLACLMSSTDLGLQILANIPAFYYGTSPNKFFDYIASGLPVLINYPGWLSEVVKKYDCGFAILPNNPEDFADALEQAAENRDATKEMGSNSKRLAESTFNRDLLSQKFVDWLSAARLAK